MMVMKTIPDNIDYLKLQRITEQLKEDIFTGLSDTSTYYCPKTPGIITGRGENKIMLDEATMKDLTRKWNVWFEQVRVLCGNADRNVYQTLITVNQQIQFGWYIRDDDLNSFIKELEALFTDVKDILSTYVNYSSYYNTETSLIVNVAAKEISLSFTDVENIYDEIIRLLREADVPDKELKEMSDLIESGKAEPKNKERFKHILKSFHDKCSKYSTELTVLSTLIQPFL